MKLHKNIYLIAIISTLLLYGIFHMTSEERFTFLINRGHSHFLSGYKFFLQNDLDQAIYYFEQARSYLSKASKIENLKRNDMLVLEEHREHLHINLAMAYLKSTDNMDCASRQFDHDVAFPIQKAKSPPTKLSVKKSVDVLREYLENNPNHLMAQWLFNLSKLKEGASVAFINQNIDMKIPYFKNITHKLGLNQFKTSGNILIEDMDGDGYKDILTVDADQEKTLRFFQNKGDGSFSDITIRSGLDGIKGVQSFIQADFNNDGAIDLFIIRQISPANKKRSLNLLYKNRGDDTFEDITLKAGLANTNSSSAIGSWVDYDNDGDLDLYVAGLSLRNPGECPLIPENNTLRRKCEKTFFTSEQTLFQNQGDETFESVTEQAGLDLQLNVSDATWGDYNADRFTDLYISTLRGENKLYRNNGDGTFSDVAAKLNVTEPWYGISNWFWDFDNDGYLDIFAANQLIDNEMFFADYFNKKGYRKQNRIYKNDGAGHFTDFTDASAELVLQQSGNILNANYGDIDNDGFWDLYFGYIIPFGYNFTPNKMLKNIKGKNLIDVTKFSGFGYPGIGFNAVFADLDNDGDQDVAFSQGDFLTQDYCHVILENPGFRSHWIALKLTGVQSNRSAIGARIRVGILEHGHPRSIHRYVQNDGGSNSRSLIQEIGLGKAEKIIALEIFWPTSNLTQKFEDVPMDAFIEIIEGENDYRTSEAKSFQF